MSIHLMMMVCTCALLFFSSCHDGTEENETYTNVEVSQETLKELSDYINYAFKWYSSTYSSNPKEFDLEHFNSHLKKFKFNSTSPTRSAESVDVIAGCLPYYKNILSAEGYDLISRIIEHEEYLSLSDLTIAISNLNHRDQEILTPAMAITKSFYDCLDNNLVTTRSVRNPTACNILASISATITGSIWGAAFGGALGYTIALAWGVAGTIAAQERCV